MKAIKNNIQSIMSELIQANLEICNAESGIQEIQTAAEKIEQNTKDIIDLCDQFLL